MRAPETTAPPCALRALAALLFTAAVGWTALALSLGHGWSAGAAAGRSTAQAADSAGDPVRRGAATSRALLRRQLVAHHAPLDKDS
ncbi:MAG TPA: hypothetical protein VMU33_19250 [Burkholderiaceae bacterium]|nr:hypothetical protein [Burkholderiaceae bacterium]